MYKKLSYIVKMLVNVIKANFVLFLWVLFSLFSSAAVLLGVSDVIFNNGDFRLFMEESYYNKEFKDTVYFKEIADGIEDIFNDGLAENVGVAFKIKLKGEEIAICGIRRENFYTNYKKIGAEPTYNGVAAFMLSSNMLKRPIHEKDSVKLKINGKAFNPLGIRSANAKAFYDETYQCIPLDDADVELILPCNDAYKSDNKSYEESVFTKEIFLPIEAFYEYNLPCRIMSITLKEPVDMRHRGFIDEYFADFNTKDYYEPGLEAWSEAAHEAIKDNIISMWAMLAVASALLLNQFIFLKFMMMQLNEPLKTMHIIGADKRKLRTAVFALFFVISILVYALAYLCLKTVIDVDALTNFIIFILFVASVNILCQLYIRFD